jgi:hypothetical protein
MRRAPISRLDIDTELMATDRILQRWARSVGCGMPVHDWDGVSSRPTELPKDAAIWVDRYVCSRQEKMRQFIHAWYRSQDASAVIARRFRLGRQEVYILWHAVLAKASVDFLGEPCVSKLMRLTESAEA